MCRGCNCEVVRDGGGLEDGDVVRIVDGGRELGGESGVDVDRLVD